MNPSGQRSVETFLAFAAGILIAMLISIEASGQDRAPQGSEMNSEQSGYDELTRGPIHEAFAEQVSLEPTPGIVVTSQPPEPISELPPENRPAAANAQWIGGYWAYHEVEEDAEGDFIWVSGVWRIPPEGFQWVPGYWTKVDEGHQWIGGFWASNERDEVTYLPKPPETLEEGPTSRAPSDEHFWVPGCWYYRNANYEWRPGYWAEVNPNYVWVPNYYRWTPGGYVLCGGYYDYSLTNRGYLFAPVHFRSPLYTRSNWHYRPSVVLDLGPLHFHLFVRPNYSHYYFGDYYGDRYANRGFYAWHNYYTRRHAYDPLLTFNVVRYRSRGIDYLDRVRGWHRWFDDHEDYRPRHTFVDQRRFEERNRDRDGISTAFIAKSFNDYVDQRRNDFRRFDDDDRGRRDFDDFRERFSQMRTQRERAERDAVADRRGDDDERPENARERDDENGRDRGRSFDLREFRRGSDARLGEDRDGDRGRFEALRPNIDRDDLSREGRESQRPDVTTRPEGQPEADARTPDDVRDQIRERLRDRGAIPGANPADSNRGSESPRPNIDRGDLNRDSQRGQQPDVTTRPENQPRPDVRTSDDIRDQIRERLRDRGATIPDTNRGDLNRGDTNRGDIRDRLRQPSTPNEGRREVSPPAERPEVRQPNRQLPDVTPRSLRQRSGDTFNPGQPQDRSTGGAASRPRTTRPPAIDRRPTGSNSGQNFSRPQGTDRAPAIDNRPTGRNSGQNMFRPNTTNRSPLIERTPSDQSIVPRGNSGPSSQGPAFRGRSSGSSNAPSINRSSGGRPSIGSGSINRSRGNNSFRGRSSNSGNRGRGQGPDRDD